ncbi:hypothetical protein KI387_033736, partial [Taxus chinensis]
LLRYAWPEEDVVFVCNVDLDFGRDLKNWFLPVKVYFGCGACVAWPAPAMSDRRKMLEALVAKRKAEAESGEKYRRNRISSISLPTKKPGIGEKANSTPLKKNGKRKEKEKSKPKPKPKRVSKMDRYETDDEEESEEEEEEEEDTTSESDEDSEEEIYQKKKRAKKLVHQSRGRASINKLGLGQTIKGKDEKGKGFLKDMGKLKTKALNSSDEGEDDDDEGDLSDESLHGVNPDNIIPDRSRRRALQPAIYQYDISSDDENDDDSD